MPPWLRGIGRLIRTLIVGITLGVILFIAYLLAALLQS